MYCELWWEGAKAEGEGKGWEGESSKGRAFIYQHFSGMVERRIISVRDRCWYREAGRDWTTHSRRLGVSSRHAVYVIVSRSLQHIYKHLYRGVCT